jgi:hypothetical protein
MWLTAPGLGSAPIIGVEPNERVCFGSSGRTRTYNPSVNSQDEDDSSDVKRWAKLLIVKQFWASGS